MPEQFVIPANIALPTFGEVSSEEEGDKERTMTYKLFEVTLIKIPIIGKRIGKQFTQLRAQAYAEGKAGLSYEFYQKSYNADLDIRILEVYLRTNLWNIEGTDPDDPSSYAPVITNTDESIVRFLQDASKPGIYDKTTTITGIPINQPRYDGGVGGTQIATTIPTPAPIDLPI